MTRVEGGRFAKSALACDDAYREFKALHSGAPFYKRNAAKALVCIDLRARTEAWTAFCAKLVADGRVAADVVKTWGRPWDKKT